MRVLVLGDSSQPLDEGMKKTTAELARALAAHCEVLVMNPYDSLRPSFWRTLTTYRPDVVHYVPGPSVLSFVLLKLAGVLGRSATVMSVTHPARNLNFTMLRPIAPAAFIVQTSQHAQSFGRLTRLVEVIPNGVDTEYFRPVHADARTGLRLKYGLSPDDFVVLHVGNSRRVRNLGVLFELQRRGCQVVLVASTTIRDEAGMAERLRRAGCRVLDTYVESVAELYALSDVYVFPVEDDQGAIVFPLSVVEAMAVGIPIVTTPFGALPEFFERSVVFLYAYDDREMVELVLNLKDNAPEPLDSTRPMVAQLSWPLIAQRVVEVYRAAIARRSSARVPIE